MFTILFFLNECSVLSTHFLLYNLIKISVSVFSLCQCISCYPMVWVLIIGALDPSPHRHHRPCRKSGLGRLVQDGAPSVILVYRCRYFHLKKILINYLMNVIHYCYSITILVIAMVYNYITITLYFKISHTLLTIDVYSPI